jgi:type IV pilus assembly protein PilV
MSLKQLNYRKPRQFGASLIEVLVAMLVLSFGMLSLAGMLSFSVQLPKLSAYRAAASNLAATHAEKVRANPVAFAANSYTSSLTYDGTFSALASTTDCVYPNCTPTTLATLDKNATEQAARLELPAGGVILKCSPSPCTQSSSADLWIMWQEPSTFATLDANNSDNCPTEVTGNNSFSPKPRCLYLRFKVQ